MKRTGEDKGGREKSPNIPPCVPTPKIKSKQPHLGEEGWRALLLAPTEWGEGPGQPSYNKELPGSEVTGVDAENPWLIVRTEEALNNLTFLKLNLVFLIQS